MIADVLSLLSILGQLGHTLSNFLLTMIDVMLIYGPYISDAQQCNDLDLDGPLVTPYGLSEPIIIVGLTIVGHL